MPIFTYFDNFIRFIRYLKKGNRTNLRICISIYVCFKEQF
jgi:hypothetical protein